MRDRPPGTLGVSEGSDKRREQSLGYTCVIGPKRLCMPHNRVRRFPGGSRLFRASLALTILATTWACDGETLGVEYGGGKYEQTIRVGDRLRDYVVYVPRSASPAEPAPVLLVFHGAAMSAEVMMLLTWFNAEADRLGAVIAYLQSAEEQWATGGASFAGAERVDDLGFVDAVLDQLARDLVVDPARVYAAGYSNGALFSQRLACQRADRIAAIGVVGATVSIPVTSACNPPRPVPAIFFVGDRDPSFPWTDPRASAGLLYTGEESANFWARLNGCADARTVTALPDTEDDGTTVDLWTFPGCPPESRLQFFRIREGGHTWPGSPLNLSVALGRKSRDIEASPRIVEFLLTTRIEGVR
jgi:polyhydroxybutyrate depolymerase